MEVAEEHVDMYGESVVADPYTYYGRMRETDPVHWNAEHEVWVVTRFEDVSWAIRHPELFSSEIDKRDRGRVDPPLRSEDESALACIREFRTHELIQNDGEEHTRMRKALSKRFSTKKLEAWRPTVRRIVGGLLDDVADNGKMDVLRDLAMPLPLLIVSELLGIPEADRTMVKELADKRMASALGSDPDRMTVGLEGIEGSSAYLEGLLKDRLANPTDDVMTTFAMAGRDGLMSHTEILANAQSLIDAGHETTIQLICNGTLAFIEHPDQWTLLRSDPDQLVALATEECLRYDPPLPMLRRVATKEIGLRDKVLREGDRVRLVLASAHRDPRAFDEPDRFDITRERNQHLAFAVGPHFCLGQYLARMEGQEVFKALATRFPRLRLGADKVQYNPIPLVRSVNALPVVWD